MKFFLYFCENKLFVHMERKKNKYAPPTVETMTEMDSRFVLCVSTDGDIHSFEYEDNVWEDMI